MLGILSRREAALKSLLNVPKDEPVGEYPNEIRLPQLILDRAAIAVAATERDTAERSIGFRHYRNRWHGGIALVGKGIHYDRSGDRIIARANRLTLIASAVNRPHIFLHTHPSLASGRYQELLEAAQREQDEYNKRKIRFQPYASADSTTGYPEECSMLPSGQDTLTFLRGFGGTVGNVVSSEEGNFLLLRQRLEHTSLLSHIEEKKQLVATGRLALQEGVSAMNEAPDDQSVQVMMAATAKATEGTFACYYSEDIASPTLARIL